MLFFGIKNSSFKIGVLLVASAWALLTLFWIYQNFYVADPYDPSRVGTDAYGHNAAGGFKTFSILVLIEYLVLLAVLLPFSFSRFYWVRLLCSQIVFGGWLFLLALGAMHSGGVYMIHLLAVFVLNVMIFISLVASVVAEIVGRKKNAAPA